MLQDFRHFRAFSLQTSSTSMGLKSQQTSHFPHLCLQTDFLSDSCIGWTVSKKMWFLFSGNLRLLPFNSFSNYPHSYILLKIKQARKCSKVTQLAETEGSFANSFTLAHCSVSKANEPNSCYNRLHWVFSCGTVKCNYQL